MRARFVSQLRTPRNANLKVSEYALNAVNQGVTALGIKGRQT
jgi:hypothetical protein